MAADVEITAVSGKCDWAIVIAKPGSDAQELDINMDRSGPRATGTTIGETTSHMYTYPNTGYESAAANELASLIERMIGAKVSVAIVSDKSEVAKFPKVIAIGRLAGELGAKPPKSTFGIDGSTVKIGKDRILLVGETPMASYFAMTRLAEMAGCIWYMPGSMGEIIPGQDKLVFKEGTYDEVPVLWSRNMWLDDSADNASDENRMHFRRWLLHNRQYGVIISAHHVWASMIPASKYFDEHPEWYRQVNGKREPLMLCTSNEEMTREFIKNYRAVIESDPGATWFSLSQDDGSVFCECTNCTALDSGLNDIITPNLPQISDRLVNFYNKVVTELVKDYPDKYFCFLAYASSTAPPVREKLHPHLMPMMAAITFSRYHAVNAKNSETMQALGSYIEGWGNASKYISFYPYSFNLADGILPYTREHQVRHDIPFMVSHGLGALCTESSTAWQNLLPWYYMMARMSLNPDLDADALVAEFYPSFFGPAAPEMKAYMGMLGAAYENFDYEVGNQWFAPLLFTPEFLDKANKLLSAAEKKASNDEMIKSRISMWRHSYKSTQLYLKMRKEMNSFEFQKASDTAGEFYALGESTFKSNPYAVSWYPFKDWWKPLWKDGIDFTARRVKGGTILHKFPDEWYAFADYSGIGEVGKLYSPDLPLTRWMKLKTYSKTIGEQNLTRFRGTIWYRNSFTVDEKDLGKKLHILFAGVDNKIKLYINGKPVSGGTDSKAYFNAFDWDISNNVQAGENTVVCAVNNESILELETGGIMMPVVLYAPAAAGR